MNEVNIRIKALLNKALSRQQIKKDLKSLESTPFLVKVLATLNQSQTKKQLRQDLKQIENATQPLNVKAKIDTKNIGSSIKKSVSGGNYTADVKAKLSIDEKDTQNKVGSLWKRVTERFGMMSIMFGGIKIAKDSIQNTLELDKSLTNLLKVSDELSGRNALPEYFRKINEQAKILSISTNDLIVSVTEFTKLGYSLDVAEELAQIASMFSNVADMPIEDASKTLISTIAAFKEFGGLKESDFEKRALAAVDVINEVGNKFAISSDGIAAGLENASASMSLAGNDLYQTIALLAGGNRILQNPEELSNALKVVSMRLTNTRGELEELGIESDGAAESITKLQTQVLNLTNGKVDIMLDEDTFKSTYDILLEIGRVFDQLSNKDQASLLELIAGKQRGNAVAAILSNIEEIPQIYETALDSTGSATAEFVKYQRSTEASIARFKETWVGIWHDVVNGEDIKQLADIGTGVLSLADRLNLLKSVMAGLAVYFGAKTFVALSSGVKETIVHINNLATAMRMLNSGNINKSGISQLAALTKGLHDSQLKLILSSKALTAQQRMQILMAQGLSKSEAVAKLETLGLSAANLTAAGTAVTLKTTLQGLWLVIQSNPLMWIATAVTLVVSAFSAFKQSQEEARQKAIEAGDAMKSEVTAIDELKAKINDETLSRESLISLMQAHNQKYGEELAAINDINEARKESIRLLDEEAKQKALEVIRETGSEYLEQKAFLENDNYRPLGSPGGFVGTPEETLEQMGKRIDDYTKRIDDLSWDEKTALGVIEKAYEETNQKIKDAKVITDNYTTSQSILNGTYVATEKNINDVNNSLDEMSDGEDTETIAEKFEKLTKEIQAYKDAQTESEREFRQSQIKEILDGINKAAQDGAITWSEYQDALNNATQQMIDYSTQLDGIQSAYNTVSKALEEYDAHNAYSVDTYQELLQVAPQYLGLLLDEDGQLSITKETLYQVAAARIDDLAAKQKTSLINLVGTYSDESEALKMLQGNIVSTTQEQINLNAELLKAASIKSPELQGEVLGRLNAIDDWAAKAKLGLNKGGVGGFKKAGATAGKEAADAYFEAFEAKLKQLKELKDNDLITEKQYLDRLRILNERYFKDKGQYAKEYAKYEQQYFDGMKSLYEKVFSWASGLHDRLVSSIEDDRDRLIESYQKQQEAIENTRQAEIDALDDRIAGIQRAIDVKQDEIDKINEAADERQRELDLQKALFSEQRAMNQRKDFVYQDGQMIYKAKDSDIRDAREDVTQAKEEIRVAAIEKEISALEKNIDALEQQKEAIQSMIDSSSQYFESMISQTESYYDTLISGMEEQKTRWDELSELEEQADIINLLRELGYTEADVLNMSSGAFEKFKQSYLGILADMNAGNQGMLDSLSQVANIDIGTVPSFLKETEEYFNKIADMDVTALANGINTVGDSFNNIATSASGAASAVSGGGSSVSNTPFSGGKSEGGGGGESASGSSLKDSIEQFSTEGVEKIDEVANAFSGGEESVSSAIQEVIGKIGSGESGGGEGNKPGKGSSGSDGETDTLTGALQAHVEAALNEDTGIPAERAAWDDLNMSLERGVIDLNNFKLLLEELDGKTFTVTLQTNGGIPSLSASKGYVDGTAHLEGTAHAKGDWGIKEPSESLMGELGREIVVRNGRFFTVGDNGPEMFKTQKGDIIFNHVQTKELLQNGKTTGRGHAYAEGTAYQSGNVVSLKMPTPEEFSRVLSRMGSNSNFDSIFSTSSLSRSMSGRNFTTVNNQAGANITQHLNVTLPSVTDGQSFINTLEKFANLAEQRSRQI